MKPYTVRLTEEQAQWLKESGGAAYVRLLIRADMDSHCLSRRIDQLEEMMAEQGFPLHPLVKTS